MTVVLCRQLSATRGRELGSFLTRCFCQTCIAVVNVPPTVDISDREALILPDVWFSWQPWPSTLPPRHPQHVTQPCWASASPSVRWRWVVFSHGWNVVNRPLGAQCCLCSSNGQSPLPARYTSRKDAPGPDSSLQPFSLMRHPPGSW